MKVIETSAVKVYDVSAGKSLPEWIGERKRRQMQKADIELRQRIELIQDFAMPTASLNVAATRDGAYVFATGTRACTRLRPSCRTPQVRRVPWSC